MSRSRKRIHIEDVLDLNTADNLDLKEEKYVIFWDSSR